MVSLFDYCADCDRKAARIAELEAIILRGIEAPSVPSRTSEDAARDIRVSLSPQRLRILTCLRTRPGTAEEVADRTGLSGNSVRPRLRECETVGWVERTSQVRATRAGRDAYVYALTEAGIDMLTDL
jgi:DNA-binding MarR family transcriptional regulator